jgi:hypothetical protein
MSTRTAYRCRECGWLALADGFCPRCGEFALVPVALVTVETLNKGTVETAEREAK